MVGWSTRPAPSRLADRRLLAHGPGLAVTGGLAALSFAAASRTTSLSPLVVGVVVGAVVANVWELPETLAPGVHTAGRHLLRAGIVLLGFRLALSDVRDIGATGLIVVAVVVGATFFGTQLLGRWLGVSSALSLLVATGFSICGASAIAAMDGVTDADEEETAYAVALVTLCGSLAIIVLPLLSGPLGLSGADFGTWVGSSVHDVAQVVAAAAHGGEEASAAAIVVKLTRVMLLAPLVAVVVLNARRRGSVADRAADDGEVARPPVVPFFVLCFLGAVVIRSSGVLDDDAMGAPLTPVISWGEKVALTMALVALGLGVRLERLRRLGGRPLALGLASWLLIGSVSYAAVVVFSAA